MREYSVKYNKYPISFSLDKSQDTLMINATEMAKVFGRRTEDFLKTKNTKEFVKIMEENQLMETEMAYSFNSLPKDENLIAIELKASGMSDDKIIRRLNRGRIIQKRGRNGVFFTRILALKFAAWLDPKFELWTYTTIDRLFFEDYRMISLFNERIKEYQTLSETLKIEVTNDPKKENVQLYFDALEQIKVQKRLKAAHLKKLK